MDAIARIFVIVGPVIFFVVLFLIFFWCYMCRRIKRYRRIVTESILAANREDSLEVPSTTHTTAGGYPISVATPSGGYQATPSGEYQATPYPTAMPMPMVAPTGVNPPYPTTPGMPMPVASPTPYPPPSAGFQPNIAPYPPAGPPNTHPSQVNPPSYDQVAALDSYGKQVPYNPNYVNPPA